MSLLMQRPHVISGAAGIRRICCRKISSNQTRASIRNSSNARRPQVCPLQPEQLPQQPQGPGLPLLLGLKQLRRGSADLVGWRVTASGDTQLGTVEQVRPAPSGPGGPPYKLLQVVQQCELQPYGFKGVESHWLPLVPDLVAALHPQLKLLVVTPPAGLLDLGRRELLLSFLSQELPQHTDQHTAPTGSPGAQPLVDTRCMPTRQQLLAAGRPDLVDLIGRVGGFAEAALLLGLRCSRRPAGYWESLELLDAELDQFIAGSWVALPDPDPDDGDGSADEQQHSFYFYNPATRSIRWNLPKAAARLLHPAATAARAAEQHQEAQQEEVEGEDEEEEVFGSNRWSLPGTASTAVNNRQLRAALMSLAEEERVMPSAAALKSAGRWDLHHAVLRNGGYKEVAQQLDRRPAWPVPRVYSDPADLGRELRLLAREQGWRPEVLPGMMQLQRAGRDDLVQAILQHGGWQATAQQLKVSTRRKARGRSPFFDLELLVEQLSAFMQQPQEQQLQQQGPELLAAGTAARLRRRQLLLQQQQRQQEWPSGLPTQAALVAAGRPDLAAGLARHGVAAVRQKLGLPPSSRKQLRKNVLRWPDVEAALVAGCSTNKEILEHISAADALIGSWAQQPGEKQVQRQQLVTTQHLSRMLKQWCDEGRCVRVGHTKASRYLLAG